MVTYLAIFGLACVCAYVVSRRMRASDVKPSQQKVFKNKAGDVSDWEKNLKLLKRAKGEVLEFTYESKGEKERRSIVLHAILQHTNGAIYLKGICKARGETRTFNTSKISTMLKVRSKRIDVDRYLEEEYDIA